MVLLEPYKIKMVEAIPVTTRAEREEAMRKAGYNPFNLPAEKVTIDLLTDSGTGAMSDSQWAGMMMGDESYAGSRSYFHFEDTVRDIFGYRFVTPTHQGRVTENLLFSTILEKGQYVVSNILFDTTHANVVQNGGVPANLVVDEAFDIDSESPFKGNLDTARLEAFIAEHGAKSIALVVMTVTNNSGGGQPVSMANIREVSAICRKHGIRLFFDAARYAENCYFIKKREAGYENRSILEIAREMFSYGEGATMSAKKDALVNIGGFITLNDEEWSAKVRTKLILIEGFLTYGGLAGRDLEAMARGLREALEENYLAARIGQCAYLGRRLTEMGVPILKPVGGHAVYLDGLRFLPHIPREQFPAQALTCAIYLEGGIRAVEIGGLMFGERDPATGKAVFPKLDLVRLTIPRRVYTNTHMDYVAECIGNLYQKRNQIKGLKIEWEAPYLRHFTVRLAEVD